MDKMKAAILEEFNTPLVVDELKIPKLECGQVLVRVYSSGICGAQIGHIAGVKVKKEFLPFLLGHEGGGEVLDIGYGVTTVKPGDRVVMHWRKGSGIESKFPSYKRSDGTLIGAGLISTFNDYAVVSENRLTKIDEDVPFDIASLMGCSVTTGLGIINNEAKLKIGQSIAVFGTGGVGLSIIQGASLVSGYPIIGIDLYDNKLDLAKEIGATHIINSLKKDVSEEIKKIVGSSGIDIFIDTTGKPELIEKSYNLTKSGGKTIMVGQPKVGEHLTLHSFLQHFNEKVLLDSNGGLTDPDVDINRYLRLYKNGILKLDKLITKRVKLLDINKTLDIIRKDSSFSGRCVIDME